jgi:rhodanese-related sulfurtransferase
LKLSLFPLDKHLKIYFERLANFVIINWKVFKEENYLDLSTILLIVAGALVVYFLIMLFMQRNTLTQLNEEDFRAGYRKGQLIDIREKEEYDGGHILGARNMPLSQIRYRKNELRTDQPVYIYCQSGVRCPRAAMTLKKYGHKEIYTLKGGFKIWSGKIKAK